MHNLKSSSKAFMVNAVFSHPQKFSCICAYMNASVSAYKRANYKIYLVIGGFFLVTIKFSFLSKVYICDQTWGKGSYLHVKFDLILRV